MIKHIKTYLTVLLMIIFLLPMQASAAERWIQSNIFEDGLEYFDVQTLKYHPENDTVTGWIGQKNKADGPVVEMEEVKIYLHSKTYIKTKSIWYDPKQKSFVDMSSRISHAESAIWPDSTVEKMAAYVCKMANVESVFSVPDNRWQWIYSTDTYTCTYARDTLIVDKVRQQVEFFEKQDIVPDGYYEDGKHPITYVRCNLVDGTVSYSRDKKHWQTNFAYPESNEEKLLNFAKTLF